MYLCLAGDVALARGIDQVLKYKNNTELYESSVKDARDYIPEEMKAFAKPGRHVDWKYIWGSLLSSALYLHATLRLANLETSITMSLVPQDYEKPVLYKMHPGNIETLKDSRIDFLNIANNHIEDWKGGIKDTIMNLEKADIAFAGAGMNLEEAKTPVTFEVKGSFIMVFSAADVSSGTPLSWKATSTKPGVNVIDLSNAQQVKAYAKFVANATNASNTTTARHVFVILSIHLMSNWGYEIPNYIFYALHYLIDHGRIDLIHGHSSHHFRPVEIYKGKLIIFGAGDIVDDYQIIPSPEQYLPWARLVYYPFYDENNRLQTLVISGYKMDNFKLHDLSSEEMKQVEKKINQICKPFQLTFKKKMLIGKYHKQIVLTI